MRRHRSIDSQGFALAYAMLVTSVFLVFFAALVVSARNTMMAVQRDEELVKARLVAAVGNELAYHLLSNREDDWYDGEFSFSNDPTADDFFVGMRDPSLEQQFSPETLGGIFRVKVQPWEEADESDLGDGTFLVLSCSAKVGRRETSVNSSSRFLVKVTNPFINNLTVGHGYLPVTTRSALKGPAIVTGADGLSGGVDFVAHTVSSAAFVPRSIFARTVAVSLDLKARGEIRVCNSEQAVGIIESRVLNKGTYAAGETELLPAPLFPGARFFSLGIGGVLFTEDSILQPNAQLLPRLPSTAEFFETLSRVTNRESFDLTAYPRGVLLEFDGERVTLHEMVPVSLGKLFDLSVLISAWDEVFLDQESVANQVRGNYGGGSNSYFAALKEVEWNDPSFADAPIPEALRLAALDQYRALKPGASLGEIPAQGDFFEIQVPSRGALLAEWNLSRDSWKLLHLSATALSGSDDDGHPIAPPLFVRGRVKGKVLVAYDLAEDLLPLDQENHKGLCDVVVLSEGDSDTGILGGLRLADETVLTEHDAVGPASHDQFFAISRGGVKSWGPPLQYMSWLVSSDGSRNDVLSQVLPGLTSEEQLVMDGPSYMRPTSFYGVSCGEVLNLNKASISASLRPLIPNEAIPSRLPKASAERALLWSDYDPSNTRDPILLNGNRSLIPMTFRACYAPRGSTWLTKGAHSGLHNTTSVLFGQNEYDYRWRSLDASTLRDHMGLPLTLTLIDRQGY